MKYFLKFDEENHFIELSGKDDDIYSDLNYIFENEGLLLDKLSDYSRSNNFSSLYNFQEDLSKKYFTLELDNANNFNEFEKISQPDCEEIIKMFEIDFNRLIKHNEELREMNYLPFNDLTEYKRFCHFCLVKKVIFK